MNCFAVPFSIQFHRAGAHGMTDPVLAGPLFSHWNFEKNRNSNRVVIMILYTLIEQP